MDSQGSKLKEESSEMVQTTPSAIDALPTTLSSLSLDAPRPKTFNDLPDELLDDIADFADPTDLPALSLVQRRLHNPARKEMDWFAQGFQQLMQFADLLLERPIFAAKVRHVNFA
ncbi:hypothetical protein BCR35DRAFT_197881 [Leucosporidium creatinivorum]|uniref:F-box domain-containing protein n=1 Tax=Leucosporidium creatinivorum TaxID=106004 RepID=A0A1Y2DM34_9BASI|nr:hypothetical protein BCR35DRAFT_197881 [Leucosporidium creatinivorum]